MTDISRRQSGSCLGGFLLQDNADAYYLDDDSVIF